MNKTIKCGVKPSTLSVVERDMYNACCEKLEGFLTNEAELWVSLIPDAQILHKIIERAMAETCRKSVIARSVVPNIDFKISLGESDIEIDGYGIHPDNKNPA